MTPLQEYPNLKIRLSFVIMLSQLKPKAVTGTKRFSRSSSMYNLLAGQYYNFQFVTAQKSLCAHQKYLLSIDSCRNQLSTIKMRNTQPFLSATRRVFCLGDSLTEGVVPATNGTTFPYSLQLQKCLRELDGLESIQVQTLTFRGLRLATLRTSLRSILDRMSQTFKPLLLTLIGIQDVMEGVDCNTIVQSIIEIHQDAHQKGIQTIAIGLPPSELQGKFFEMRATVEQVNRELILWASYNHMVAFVPFPISQCCNSVLARDGYHFTEEGYRRIGARLTPIVHESLSRR